MPYAKSIPFEEIVPAWPEHLFSVPPGGGLAIVGYEVVQQGTSHSAWIDIAVATDLTFTIVGLDGLELLLPGTGENPLRCTATLSGSFEAIVEGFDVELRITSELLLPMSGPPPDGVPTPGQPLVATLNIGSLVIDESLQPRFELDGSASLGVFMVGDTGIVIEATGVRPVLSANEPPPAGLAAGFRGLAIESATVHLPDAFAVSGILPESIALTGLAIGNGGISGAIAGAWQPLWTGSVPSGPGAGSFLGMAFALRSLGIVLMQNAITGAQLNGELRIPFFDELVSVTVQIGADGSYLLEVTGGPTAERTASNLATIHKAGIGTLELTGMGAVRDENGDALLLSGRLTLEVGFPVLTWPTIEVQDLRIAPDGKVQIPGGWIDLQQPIALDLYGFGMEITRIGFGNEEDGRRWIGVDGAIRLTELLPAGASARGFRVIWDPENPGSLPTLALDGIGVAFGVPDAFAFEGEVALADDPETGLKLFTGSLGLGLDALDVGVDADIIIGRQPPNTYVYVHLGVNVPIPIAATGAALYGMEALFAMNMAPSATGGDWYGWYKKPTAFEVTDPFKWGPQVGAWAFGAGLSLGTLPDAGFSVNTKGLLVVLLPGPVILLEGKADIFTPPVGLAGESEGTLSLLAALDGRAGTLQLGIDAAWGLPLVLEIAASTEAYFEFDRLDAWHLWIGQDMPESARIGADYLSLFHADAWLMLDTNGVDTGLGVGWGDSWKYGPARVALEAWIGGRATLTKRPPQLAGELPLGGEASIAAGPFGTGINVEATLSGKSLAPYEVKGTLAVVVALPFPLKDLDVDIELEWSQPQTPVIEDPWIGALLEHERCTESWSPLPTASGGLPAEPAANAPVVPLDAGVLLTFAKAMGDDTDIADNPPSSSPVIPIGDYEATYTLTDVRLHRRRRTDTAWDDVTDTVFGAWTPGADDAGTRLQLFARTPFAFTRFTSRRWIDSFLERGGPWPCSRAPSVDAVCVDWKDRPLETRMPALWQQNGATFASDATLRVLPSSGLGRVLGLGSAGEVGGDARPGVLWVGLPGPASEVSAQVIVAVGDWVLMRAWAGDQQLGKDARLVGSGELKVVADGIESLTLDWGFNVESGLDRICWVSQAETDASRAWSGGHDRLEAAAERWESEEPVLDPDSHYLLEVTTRALLTKKGDEVQRVEEVHRVEFQTGGPPGIVPAWVPAPAAPGVYPYEGVLRDLAPYVRWPVPAPGAVPVFRAYDLGCEFNATHVQQMYGADMRIRLRDDNGQPVLDADGQEVVFANTWEEAPTTTLSTSEAAWLSRLDACTDAVAWTEFRGDDQVRTAVPSLLYDDFSGTLVTEWRPFVLDRSETRAAQWHVDGGVLRQDVDVAGGDASPESPDKPGTTYIAVGVAASDVALETIAWATSGAYGLVFRWQGPRDYYRFSVGPQRFRLVRVRDGIPQELWSRAEGYVPDAPIVLAVQAEGARIRCQIGERLVCDVEDADAGAPASGSVGLYTWNSTTAAFDEIRARQWPGAGLAAERAYDAELEASRPLFTDAFENLDAFEQQLLDSGDTVDTCSAAGGTAIIARPKANDAVVVALAGDPNAADYSVECNARANGDGPFGLVARHTSSAQYLALELTPGVGRTLVAHSVAGFGKVLWSDAGTVAVGNDYALSLRCEGTAVTFSIDDETFTANTTQTSGRFGLLSGIAKPDGCAVTDLVLRSTPRVPVHSWRFTTSRYLGLPDLLDSFAGQAWPSEGAAPDSAALSAAANSAMTRIAAARDAVDVARSDLAAAVAAGEAIELPVLGAATLAMVDVLQAECAEVHDTLTAVLGLPWRPTPPVVEVSQVEANGQVVALLLDLPEPLPWERVAWNLTPTADGSGAALVDLILVWSGDCTSAILVRTGGAAFAHGNWTLGLALRLDVGAERAVWRRGGSTAPEVGALRFPL